jgi:hypothetical protein
VQCEIEPDVSETKCRESKELPEECFGRITIGMRERFFSPEKGFFFKQEQSITASAQKKSSVYRKSSALPQRCGQRVARLFPFFY